MRAQAVDGTIDILLVEDNPGDVRLTKEALKFAKVTNRLHAVSDGEAALKFLMQRGEYVDAPRPHIVLLDLNLPRKNGNEILKEIKTDKSLRNIPVIILTTSNDPNDVAQSYNHYANCYVCKPMELSVFHEVVRKIDEFWFTVARLPMA